MMRHLPTMSLSIIRRGAARVNAVIVGPVPAQSSRYACRACRTDSLGLYAELTNCRQYVFADLLTTVADLGAHSAVLMHMRVSIAFVTAHLASLSARLDDRSDQ